MASVAASSLPGNKGNAAAVPVASAPSSGSSSSSSSPSAAVQALNAAREEAVSKGESAYAGTKANLATFTSANPSSGGSTGSTEPALDYSGTSTGGVILRGADGKPNYPTLVTSANARTTYANNVTNLQGKLTGISNTNNNPSVVDYLNKSGMPSDYNSRAALAASHGITGYTGSASQNLQLLSALSATGGTDSKKEPTGPGNPQNPLPNPTSIAPATGAVAPSTDTGTQTTSPTGDTATPTKNPDGSTNDPNDPTSGLPPAIASAFKDTLVIQDQNIQQAQTTLDQAKATLTNDPAATAAASMISSQYETLISAMKAKNAIVLGSYRENSARSGSLQYANDMDTTFMSSEMDRASARIADLVTKESQLILKSNTAYQNGDVKTFNAAQAALDKATNAKTTTLGKLLTASNNQVKAVQAQQRLDQTTKKNGIAADVTVSAKTAAGIVEALATAGITDPKERDAYIVDMAQKNGITNPDILRSAVVTAEQQATKASLSNANVRSEITKRGQSGSGNSGGKGGTDGGYKYSADDVSTYTGLLNKGGKGPDGTVYASRGKTDGFADPSAYLAAYHDWVDNHNGTPAGFAKKFPVKTNVNPDSYSSLPAAIQPAAAKGTTPTHPV